MQQEMKYIYTVYQKGSFSKAAEALFMTQPHSASLSRKSKTRLACHCLTETKSLLN